MRNRLSFPFLLFCIFLRPALSGTIAEAYTIYPDCGGSPCPAHVSRLPTPDELVGLTEQAYADYFWTARGLGVVRPDATFKLTPRDSNEHGWIIGDVFAAVGGLEGYTAFVFHSGVGVICCRIEDLQLTAINNKDMVIGYDDGGSMYFDVHDVMGEPPDFFKQPVQYSDGQPYFDFSRPFQTFANPLDDGRIVTVDGSVLVPVPEHFRVHRLRLNLSNSATSAPTSAAPGEVVTITGLGLGPATAAVARPSAAGVYGTDLGGTSVSFDGIPAPMLYAQNEQINAIVPYGIQGRTSTRLQVRSATDYSVPIDIKVVDAAPGIFTTGRGGRGQAAASNADGIANSVLNPADRGSVIVLYLTGEGQTAPPGQDGRVITTDLHTPLLPVTATIGGRRADVLYAGSAAMQVSGIFQVNLRIPADLAPGTQPVEVQVGGIPTQHGVTIVVR